MKHIILFFILSIAQLVLAAQPSATLPVLYIQTQNSTPITSKDYYLQATYYLDAKALTGIGNQRFLAVFMVEISGIEPLTS